MSKISRAISSIKKSIPYSLHPLFRETLGFILSLVYKGNQVICPCCETKFRSFMPGGVDNRPNAYCPKCGSFERHRALWLYIKQKTNFFSAQSKVLHFAPEYIFQKKFKQLQNIDYISADLDSPLAKIKANITSIPFENNTFDIILCNHVLEHILNDRLAMKELYRVLKPTGWAILQVPLDRKREKTFEDDSVIAPLERERLFGKDDHVRVYGLDYKDRLEEVGFEVKVDHYIQNFSQQEIEKYGLPGYQDIYFCKKKQ